MAQLEPPPSLPSFRPRPWIAALLGVLFPGLGHLYAGRPARGVCIYVGVQLWVVGLVLLTFAMPTPLLRLAATVLALVGALLVPSLDAARVARRSSAGPRGAMQQWYVLTSVLLLGVLGLHPRTLDLIKRYVAEAFRLPSGPMAPTMMPGDYIFASPHVPATPTRGAVVIYRVEGDRFTHRVVGLPGDTLEMRGFKLLVNGVPAVEPYAHATPDAGDVEVPEFAWQRAYLIRSADSLAYRARYGTWGPLVVPASQYFLLGDDRANSLDSRYRGFVRRDALAGRPVWIYFSRDPESGEVRWERIGRGIS